MSWRGFLTESKSFMNYPHCGRLVFWLRYPFAWFSYRSLMRGSDKNPPTSV